MAQDVSTGGRPSFQVREMKAEEIPGALQVWRETGLVEGTHTIDTWFAVDPKGFFVAADDDTGDILGVCAGVNLHCDLAFVGLYAVLERYRGLGIGRRVWEATMAHLGTRNAGLNSVPEHLHTYRDLAGFSVMAPWTSSLYDGTCLTPERLLDEVIGIDVLPYHQKNLKKVTDFDASIHGYKRDRIVELSIDEEDSITVVAVKKSDGVVCGYGSIRGNVQPTALIGPVYADESAVAEVICRRLVEDFPQAGEQGLTMPGLSTNPNYPGVAEKLGLTKQMDLPRCYTQHDVDVDFARIYALHSLNFSAY